MSEEKRIYVVLPATVDTIHTRYDWVMSGPIITTKEKKVVVQLPGRQIAQAAHVVSKLRHELGQADIGLMHNKLGCGAMSTFLQQEFVPITTIILEARNQKEMMHLFTCLTGEGKQPTLFQDENPAVYGDSKPITAMAVYAMPLEVENTLGYLPLWGAQ